MRPTPRRSLARALALCALTVTGTLAAAGPALAAPTPPQLSISVDDGQTDARSGSTLRYVVTVTNLGTETVRDLVVSQTVPAGATLAAVGADGTQRKDGARWTVDLRPGRTVTLPTTVEVGEELGADVLRLASVACAATSGKAAPTVCASDSDQLPAGAVAAEQQRQVDAAPAAAQHPGWLLPAGLGLAGLAAVGALVVVGAGRTRREQAGSAQGASLARRGAGAEDVAPAEPGAREVLQR